MANANGNGGGAPNITIIRKKKGGGGHGHHGGAWKVAYADFVTAMMAFFMVMWLMGVDEETKKSISEYFNHPDSVGQKLGGERDPSKTIHVTDTSGPGESVLNGSDGRDFQPLSPESVVNSPKTDDFREIGQMLNEVLGDQAFGVEVEMDFMKFYVLEAALLTPGTSQLTKKAGETLNRIGKILQGFKGHVTIEDHSDELVLDNREMPNLYEAAIIKSVAIMNYLTEHNLIPLDRIHPVVGGQGKDKSRGPAVSKEEKKSGGKEKNRFEFKMTRTQ